MSQGKIAFD